MDELALGLELIGQPFLWVVRSNIINEALSEFLDGFRTRIADHGRIVNFSTIAVPLSLEGELAYGSSKAAIESLTRVLAKEIAVFGITVNAIGPTPIQTDLIAKVPEEKLKAILKTLSIHRYGEVEDIVNIIDFYLNPRSDFVTGQVLYLGGVS